MKDLHELSREYAQSVIDRDTYRNDRKELIQGICSGEIKLKKRKYLTPFEALPNDLDNTIENMNTQIVNPSKNTTSKREESAPTKQTSSSPKISKQKNIIIGMVSVIVLCIIILIFLLLSDSEKKSSTDIAPTVTNSSVGQNLISDFILQKNWTRKNLESFITSWQQLSTQQQSTAFTSPEMTRLINTIYQNLLDERALLSLGDVENAVNNQRMLVNFSEQLGIEDKRLNVVEPDTKTAKQSIENTVSTISPEKESVETDIESIIEIENKIESLIDDQNTIEEDPLKTNTNNVIDQIQSSPLVITKQTNTTQKNVEQKIKNKAACKSSLVKSRKPYCRDMIENAGNGPTMVVIKGGNFIMGGKNKDEQPAHEVAINSHFALSVHEISYGEYNLFCKSSNSLCPKQPWSGKDYPVVNITQNDASAYTEWLSKKTGQKYRLPSEAEWEYAARAGTQSKYPFGDEILITNAVYSDKKQLSAPLPKSDRSINKNKFRLYHMVGNVREWVADTWLEGYSDTPKDGSAHIESTANQYVVRGGSYADSADALRSGAREKLSSADNYTGFRVLQELSE